MTQPTQLMLKEKPAKALVYIRQNKNSEVYGSKVSRNIDTTYAHTIKILAKMEKQNLIQTRTKGRKKLLDLTKEGKELADNLQQIMGNQTWKKSIGY